jgi:hypothetical protein
MPDRKASSEKGKFEFTKRTKRELQENEQRQSRRQKQQFLDPFFPIENQHQIHPINNPAPAENHHQNLPVNNSVKNPSIVDNEGIFEDRYGH